MVADNGQIVEFLTIEKSKDSIPVQSFTTREMRNSPLRLYLVATARVMKIAARMAKIVKCSTVVTDILEKSKARRTIVRRANPALEAVLTLNGSLDHAYVWCVRGFWRVKSCKPQLYSLLKHSTRVHYNVNIIYKTFHKSFYLLNN